MRKIALIITIFILAGLFYGCGRKQQSLEEMQQPMSMETLVTMSTTSPVAGDAKASEVNADSASILGPASASTVKLEPLPPPGPYKPTAYEIQAALKNAGFYSGAIDGKIGPVSKKAIVEFQKANDLAADGKVGPKTWAVLSLHLRPAMQDTGKAR